MTVYLICYGAGMLFASSAHYYLSGACLMAAAVYLYFYDYRRTGNPLHLRALFSLFWVGGEGISCLKLSRLQTDWSLETWAVFFVAFTAFWTVFHFLTPGEGQTGQISGGEKRLTLGAEDSRGLFEVILILTAVSFCAFLLEAAVLGYVPFLYAACLMPIPIFIFPVSTMLRFPVCWFRLFPWCFFWETGHCPQEKERQFHWPAP